jgi:hypothetical protein
MIDKIKALSEDIQKSHKKLIKSKNKTFQKQLISLGNKILTFKKRWITLNLDCQGEFGFDIDNILRELQEMIDYWK